MQWSALCGLYEKWEEEGESALCGKWGTGHMRCKTSFVMFFNEMRCCAAADHDHSHNDDVFLKQWAEPQPKLNFN